MFFQCKMMYLVMSKKRIHYSCEGGIENPYLVITICHHSASLVMPIGDPRDGFFYPTLTLMMDTYNIKWVKTAETLIWCAIINGRIHNTLVLIAYEQKAA